MDEPLRPSEEGERDEFFGALYYETTAELLTEGMTRTEAALISGLLEMEPAGRYLDLGCGHGRHLRAMYELGFPHTYGLDRSRDYLRLAARGSPPSDWSAHRGDVTSSSRVETKGEKVKKEDALPLRGRIVAGDTRDLPLRDSAFDGAYSWYSSLFFFDDETNRRVLKEATRTLKPGGLLLLNGTNPKRLGREPIVRHVGRTRAGGLVEELARFDSSSGVERFFRRLTRRDGSVLEGRWSMRHYGPKEMVLLLRECGCVLEKVSDEHGRPFDESGSLDMVTLARRSNPKTP